MRHNVAMKILGDYATQCYDEDIGRLGNTLLRWRYWEIMHHNNATMKRVGDYATQCCNEDSGRLCNTMLRWSRERLESQPWRADDEVCRNRRAVFIASPPRAGINIAAKLQHILGRWDEAWGRGTRKGQMAQHLPSLGSWVISSSISRVASYGHLVFIYATWRNAQNWT
jgi:hypothetical protein